MNLVTTSDFSQEFFNPAPLFEPPHNSLRNRPWLPRVTRQFCFSEVTSNSSKKISKQIKKEHKTKSLPGLNERLWFIMTDFSAQHHAIDARGELDNYLATIDQNYAGNPLFLVLCDHLTKLSNYENEASSSEDLKQRKTFTRDQFVQLLEKHRPIIVSETDWSYARDALREEGMGSLEIRKVARQWKRYAIERINPPRALAVLQQQVLKSLKTYTATEPRLRDVISHAVHNARNIPPAYDSYYLAAMAILEFLDEA